MPIDTSIYQNYLKPPKSIAEYGAEMDAADQNRMTLESGRMNLLAAKQAQADEQAVRAAYQQPGFDPQSDSGIMELMRLNPKAGFAAAEARQKALKAQADLGHVAAQTDSQRASAQKSTIEAAGTRLKQYRDTLDFIDTPEAAARWITAQFQDPLVSGQMAALGSPEQAVSRIPRDPAGFKQWRQQAAMGMEKHIAEMRQQGVADESARHNRTSEGIQIRGQNMVDARAKEANSATVQAGKAPAGYRFKPDGTLEAIPGGPADTKLGGPGAKAQDAADVLSILSEAEPLLAKSTGSYIGTAADEAARTVGISTSGAQASAQLKALQGALVSKMPKMSGPQSDKDVELYREMAGQIGDSTIPIATRRAAIGTIRKLNEKYAGGAPASSGGWTVQEVK